MAILVTYASKHGSTQGIAERVAQTLRRRGLDAQLRPLSAAGDVASYDAAVIGSAVYFGSWMKEAADFVRRNRATLAARPVWLFSSGPVGQAVQLTPPKELAEFQEAIHPRDHRIFSGMLDRGALSFPERLAVKAVKAPEGDFRDWDAVEDWAEGIAHALTPAEASRPWCASRGCVERGRTPLSKSGDPIRRTGRTGAWPVE